MFTHAGIDTYTHLYTGNRHTHAMSLLIVPTTRNLTTDTRPLRESRSFGARILKNLVLVSMLCLVETRNYYSTTILYTVYCGVPNSALNLQILT